MDNDVKQLAIAFWQDRLAKFFPTSKGPTNTEIEMFKGGWEARAPRLSEKDKWAYGSGPGSLSGNDDI